MKPIRSDRHDPSSGPHPEELARPFGRANVSKDGRGHGLACLRPSRRRALKKRAPSEDEGPEPSALTMQLLSWVANKPRSYGEAMEAWRTSCPRMPIWEDAVSDGLVAFDGNSGMKTRAVVLTDRGRALLETHRPAGQSRR